MLTYCFSDLRLSLLLAAFACILRPTNVLIWSCLAGFLMFRSNSKDKIALVTEAIAVGYAVQSAKSIECSLTCVRQTHNSTSQCRCRSLVLWSMDFPPAPIPRIQRRSKSLRILRKQPLALLHFPRSTTTPHILPPSCSLLPLRFLPLWISLIYGRQ